MVTLTHKCIVILGLALVHHSASARGSLTLKHTEFDGPPLLEEQQQKQTQIITEIEGDADIGTQTLLEFSLRGIASTASNNAHFGDVRVLRLLVEGESWEWSFGQQDIHWGFLNAYNPTDGVNPTDRAYDFQGKTHLGQAGMTLRYYSDTWNLSALMARSRASRYAEYEDHYRVSPLAFSDDHFEKSETEPKLALRFYRSMGNLELAFSHFYGHSNNPTFLPELHGDELQLKPTYRVIEQSGLELQYILGDCVLRSELAYTKTNKNDFGYHQFRAGVGIERVKYGFIGNSDLLLYLEGYYAQQSDAAPRTNFDRDWVVGARYIANNASNSELIFQWIYDHENSASMLESRYQRAIGQRYSLALTGYGFHNTDGDPPLSGFKKDSHVSLELGYHF